MMGARFLQAYSFYATVLRLWLFLVLLMVIVSVMFPGRLPLCGSGASSLGGKFRFSDFALVLASNGVAGAVLVKIRAWRFTDFVAPTGRCPSTNGARSHRTFARRA